jgi:hypothetical protein
VFLLCIMRRKIPFGGEAVCKMMASQYEEGHKDGNKMFLLA